MKSSVTPGVIRVASAPEPLEPVTINEDARRAVHMAASLLLDYPDAGWVERLPAITRIMPSLPGDVRERFASFLAEVGSWSDDERGSHFVSTFDLKRKCCLYLSYYGSGDTRRRGQALVRFKDAYRAGGWEFDAAELPDYLPAVLEFAAVSDSPIAHDLLASHRDGIEVLRAALLAIGSPYVSIVETVCLTLPAVDADVRSRILTLINEGPPAETVGVSFLGNLPPYTPAGESLQGVHS